MVDSAEEQNLYFTMYNRDTDEHVEVELDFKSRNQVVMPPEHHAIHRRQMFKISEIEDVGNGGTLVISIVPPVSDKEVHFRFKVSSELEAHMGFYENPDTSSGGTVVAPANKHRRSPVAADTVVRKDPTYTVGSGSRLDQAHLGSGRQSSGSFEDLDEWILNDGVTYLIILTNLTTNNNQLEIAAEFYEYIPYFDPPS